MIIQSVLNDNAKRWMPSTPNFTTAIYSPKMASKLKRIHHSSISHRVKIFVDKAYVIAVLQSRHSLRSYRNARNLCPLFPALCLHRPIVPVRTLRCFHNNGKSIVPRYLTASRKYNVTAPTTPKSNNKWSFHVKIVSFEIFLPHIPTWSPSQVKKRNSPGS